MSSFYATLVSNTPVEGNTTSRFTNRLPKKLQFNSKWSVGLSVLSYPHSWPTLGTTTTQSISVCWRSGRVSQLSIPRSNYQTPQHLENGLTGLLRDGHAELLSASAAAALTAGTTSPKRATRTVEPVKIPTIAGGGGKETYETPVHRKSGEPSMSTPPPVVTTLAEWIQIYQHVGQYVRLTFKPEQQRFHVWLDTKYIERLVMTTQLSYVLGFPNVVLSESATLAKFIPDMRGGLSSLYVYAPDLIESSIIGDTLAPLLRIVNVHGAPDELIEENYIAVQYHKLLVKEVSEITIEIRTPFGELVPFAYGTCTPTLHFKKEPYY
jgi:hypothetical protein